MRLSAKIVGAIVLMTALVLSSDRLQAQQQAPGTEAPAVPLKVTVTIARFDGEKKTASLPFVMWVNTAGSASVQMGSEVPVPTTTFAPIAAGGAATVPATSYSYKSVGTNITCQATALADGLYRLALTVNDSQVFHQDSAGVLGPTFQSFKSENSPILRDGQTAQFAVATDKTSGEVIKLEVALSVVK